MASTKKLLAFDLGAESGRGVLGLFDGSRLRLEVVHRFPTGAVRTLDTLHWDVLRFYSEMLAALRRCAAEQGGIDSVGVDTWGVDFGLIAENGDVLGNPFHYRDSRTDGMLEKTFKRLSKGRIFQSTGVQFMEINSLYQLVAMRETNSKRVRQSIKCSAQDQCHNRQLCFRRHTDRPGHHVFRHPFLTEHFPGMHEHSGAFIRAMMKKRYDAGIVQILIRNVIPNLHTEVSSSNASAEFLASRVNVLQRHLAQ